MKSMTLTIQVIMLIVGIINIITSAVDSNIMAIGGWSVMVLQTIIILAYNKEIDG